MANKRISQLPFVGNTGYTVNDIMPIVNYDVTSGTTKHTPLVDLKTYITSGLTGTSLYEVGLGIDSTQRINTNNAANGNYSLVGGGSGNTVLSSGSTINGGYRNTIDETTSSAYYSFPFSTINGGGLNTITKFINLYSPQIGSVIGGGLLNTVSSYYIGGDVIGGGILNTTSGGYTSTISGGINNLSCSGSFVGGGQRNCAKVNRSAIVGGELNRTLDGVIIDFTYNFPSYAPSSTYLGNPSSTSGNGFGSHFLITTDSMGMVSSVVIAGFNGGGYDYKVGDTITILGSDFGFPGNDLIINVTKVTKTAYSFVGAGTNNTAFGDSSVVTGGAQNISAGNRSIIGSGYLNIALGCSSVVGGGELNRVFGDLSSIVGGNQNSVLGVCSIIGGGYGNVINGKVSSISGGYSNTTNADYSSISGGYCNLIKVDRSFIGGGEYNVIGKLGVINNVVNFTYTGSSVGTGNFLNVSPTSSSLVPGGTGALFEIDFIANTISGVYIIDGGENYTPGEILTFDGSIFSGISGVDDVTIEVSSTTVLGYNSIIGGGRLNKINTQFSVVGGGLANTTSGYVSTIGGGTLNTALDVLGTISGGYCNTAGRVSTIGGGIDNKALYYSTIGGGSGNLSNGLINTIGGGSGNIINSSLSIIGGGVSNTIDYIGPPPSTGATPASLIYGSIIGGGSCNTISTYSSYYSLGNTIAGGSCNTTVSTYYNGQTIGGGYKNTTLCDFSTISGGYGNTASCYSFIGGGACNITSNNFSFIGGGYNNTANCDNSVIGGGESNTSNGNYSTIGGGCNNKSSCFGSTISGGYNNTASGCFSTIVGGTKNTVSHDYSSTAGYGVYSVSACTFHTNYLGLQNTPQTDSTNNNVLVRDVTTGVVKQRDLSTTLLNHGSFYSKLDQPIGSVGTTYTMSAETQSIASGVVLSNGGRYTLTNGGVYNIQFSAQLEKTTGTKSNTFIWLYKNGSNVPYSNTDVTIALGANERFIVSWNFVEKFNAGEYFEINWSATNTNTFLAYVGSPTYGPEIPSVIITISQVA